MTIRLAEIVASVAPGEPRLEPLHGARHRHLLESGGDESFWEEWWLRDQLARWERPTA